MLAKANEQGVKKARIHILLDGRDVPETSALDYVDPFEEFWLDSTLTTGLLLAADVWLLLWTVTVLTGIWFARAGISTSKVKATIIRMRMKRLLKFAKQPARLTRICPHLLFLMTGRLQLARLLMATVLSFSTSRGDRGLEITAAFEQDDFDNFDRGPKPDVIYAGMMEYDGDAHAPKKYLVNPPDIERTMGEYLCASDERQLAISETQKFGHVTYFSMVTVPDTLIKQLKIILKSHQISFLLNNVPG